MGDKQATPQALRKSIRQQNSWTCKVNVNSPHRVRFFFSTTTPPAPPHSKQPGNPKHVPCRPLSHGVYSPASPFRENLQLRDGSSSPVDYSCQNCTSSCEQYQHSADITREQQRTKIPLRLTNENPSLTVNSIAHAYGPICTSSVSRNQTPLESNLFLIDQHASRVYLNQILA